MAIDPKYFQAIDTLKVLNQAVTTSRLYPAVSPQVSLAVEKAYKETKKFAREYGELSFGRNEERSMLCGAPIPETLVGELHDLIIYRQLDLLRINHVVLRPGFDRVVFSRILSIFIARKEKINREGGGRPFVTGQGLDDFFPEEYIPLPQEKCDEIDEESACIPVDRETITNDQLSYLFGEHARPEVLASLERLMRDREAALEIIVAGVARIVDHFKKLEKKDFLVTSASLTGFFNSAQTLIKPEDINDIAGAAAQRIASHAEGRLLCILFIQKYPDGLGASFFEHLVNATSNESFADIIQLLRERKKTCEHRKQQATPQGTMVSATLEKLLGSMKGKQFLGREKAQQLIQEGEKERQTKRVKTGVSALVDGNVESLRSDEIVFSLPSTVDRLISENKFDDAVGIIEKVSAEMLGGDDTLRKRLIPCIILIGEKLLDEKRWDWLEKMTGALISWIRESDEGDFVFEKAVFLLQAIMEYAWKNKNYNRGDQVQSVLYKIRSGQLSKSPPVLALVGRIQDRSFDRDQVETFLSAYLADKGDGRFGQRLSMLGRPAGNHLIGVLLGNENTEERLKIIEVLTNMGPVVVPVLIERLQEPMPWFGKRNLIKLAAEVAGPEHVEIILPFLRHEDIRVQREAFVCIYIISGEARRSALLKCLDTCSEDMYPQVIKALLPYSDEEIAGRLETLMEDQKYFSENIREPLVLEIINVLSRSGTEKGRQVIKEFLSNRDDKAYKEFKAIVWEKAETGLMQIETSLGSEPVGGETYPPESEKSEGIKPPKKIVIPDAPASNAKKQKKTFDYSKLPGSAKIMELLSENNIEQARNVLSDTVAAFARKRKFDVAERYREWLMDIDPMALTEIIRAAEVIEEEKVASVDRDHAETWSGLYDVLSTEEFATLYHAMKQKTYQNEELIVNQGSMQSGLYFISSGKVKIFFTDKRGEVLVKVATKGEILGAETVFDASVWTVSAASMTRSQVMVLKTDKIAKWRDDYPSLESKLSDFCMKSESLKQFFKISGKDRRQARRFKLAGRTNNMLLDSKGNDTGITSKGDLFDISTGGVSFYLRISQKKNAKLLLGRGMRITLPTSGTTSKQMMVTGAIIAVRGHQAMENEYSVHVKFIEPLGPTELQSIVKASQ